SPDAAFRKIRQTYFPRWRTAAKWKVVIGYRASDAYESAWCALDKKTMWFAPSIFRGPRAQRDCTLIHEMAHAVTGRAGLRHGKSFGDRMAQAASVANARGDSELAGMIEKEAEVSHTSIVTAKDVYAVLSETVFECVMLGAAATYDEIVRELSRRYQKTREEWDDWLPRAKRVFDKSVREARREMQILKQLRPAG
ncbi:MAG: hypothetical protein ABIG68_10905, partial [Acidobacteriota bacterium]